MRIEGTLKSWNDERGFGFIAPTLGGQEVFVHIKAFETRMGRPQVGQSLTFEIGISAEGKKRAQRVQPARVARVAPHRRSNSPAQWGTASYFAIPAFLLLYLVADVLWRVPSWAAALYAVASIATFTVYAIDKSAATAGRRRVSEATLIFMGLAGGWPGAIVAQQILRHKTSKAAFRSTFWGSVLLNVGAFVALSSPLLARLHP